MTPKDIGSSFTQSADSPHHDCLLYWIYTLSLVELKRWAHVSKMPMLKHHRAASPKAGCGAHCNVLRDIAGGNVSPYWFRQCFCDPLTTICANLQRNSCWLFVLMHPTYYCIHFLLRLCHMENICCGCFIFCLGSLDDISIDTNDNVRAQGENKTFPNRK